MGAPRPECCWSAGCPSPERGPWGSACAREGLSLRTRDAFLTETLAQPAGTFKLHLRLSGDSVGGAHACWGGLPSEGTCGCGSWWQQNCVLQPLSAAAPESRCCRSSGFGMTPGHSSPGSAAPVQGPQKPPKAFGATFT